MNNVAAVSSFLEAAIGQTDGLEASDADRATQGVVAVMQGLGVEPDVQALTLAQGIAHSTLDHGARLALLEAASRQSFDALAERAAAGVSTALEVAPTAEPVAAPPERSSAPDGTSPSLRAITEKHRTPGEQLASLKHYLDGSPQLRDVDLMHLLENIPAGAGWSGWSAWKPVRERMYDLGIGTQGRSDGYHRSHDLPIALAAIRATTAYTGMVDRAALMDHVDRLIDSVGNVGPEDRLAIRQLFDAEVGRLHVESRAGIRPGPVRAEIIEAVRVRVAELDEARHTPDTTSQLLSAFEEIGATAPVVLSRKVPKRAAVRGHKRHPPWWYVVSTCTDRIVDQQTTLVDDVDTARRIIDSDAQAPVAYRTLAELNDALLGHLHEALISARRRAG